MRIKRLTVAGFGPYKNEQHVDFERFRDDGLFLITGKTGAGKSSILDAICYALYGSIPRYDNAQQKLRSDYCTPDDPTFVELVFSVNGTEYQVRRSPEFERPKARGVGTTLQKPTAVLSQRSEAGGADAGAGGSRTDDSDWVGVAARPVDVGHELDRVLGLTKDQFLQVILLAQNRFQEFLLSKNDDRQAVLRSLFGTRRFDHIETTLVERRKALAAELESAREKLEQQASQVRTLLDAAVGPATGDDAANATNATNALNTSAPTLSWFEAALAAIDEQLDAATLMAEEADAAFDAADATVRALVDIQRLQIRRDGAAATLGELDANRDGIEADRRALAAAHRAAVVWPHLVARQNAEAARDAALTEEEEAREAFEPFAAESSATPAELASPTESLAATIDELTRTIGTLDTVRADERRLPTLLQEVESLQRRVGDIQGELEEASARSVAVPAQIDDVAAELTEAQIAAAAQQAATEKINRLTVARDAARSAIALETQHREALTAETDASGEHSTAAALIHDLMRRRLAGHAAELAAELQPGEACSVCGSPAHPAPATAQAEPVTADDVERARSAADVRRGEMDAAHERVLHAATALAEARAAAAGKTVDELDAELIDARAALAEATTAARSVAALEARHEALRGELEGAAVHLTALRDEKETAAATLAEVEHTCADIRTRIARYRGAFESVAGRASWLQDALAAATSFAAALRSTQSARSAYASAAAALTEQLREQGFVTEDDVAVARRTSAEMAALDARITLHDQARSTALSILAEPEIVGLPAEPVELEGPTARLADARAARDAALRERSVVAERQGQLARIVAKVRDESAASAQLQEEYAQLHELASVVQGKDPNTKRMRLETYVLAAQLEEIVASANIRLRAMTSGRYALEHDDSVQYRNTQSGLGLTILDQHTGRARATNSLSGGETFLASLALALGLAEVVTNQAGGITLDTLFVDEGFGSLDSDTLEIAMGTLDSLRAGGRTIGLISHVDAMKEQIPAKLRIIVTDRGYSEIQAG
ncbi:AAA family ATPase [Leifsonia sp. A12D58]|uniref:AAA family ATPase n=1 Tax=Leifsonia sp. A12D58 TaxID=3397674 RepID=UPI0039E05B8B